MERVATLIVDKRGILFFIFIAAALFCAVSRNWVSVCDDITRYLPDETETRRGIDLMDREFTTFATAKVMVTNITYDKAQELNDAGKYAATVITSSDAANQIQQVEDLIENKTADYVVILPRTTPWRTPWPSWPPAASPM